ncbi:SDR family NAD(P)-dependent oxidoreductase [Cecembia calidifontis]|jgi:NAD(P)-dependent dehydrogenase (short-subunit alcohol dehydrogenase family)|uniref:NAD(P)-dependent dehydrogenase (Short-subunit alcohol dehydrogenase family) n=1 Tax=Cecembia calidifontis TaxID=1187080 RepID=A0A4Q7PDF9_9BACT|nr:SDR family oxidoreductase [Cecembia calidifontis]RZS98127.1 NAD(P)-dependent dehydrogenase (short-subunit alcohol dehydrogenase family) [Cecembia calidifontis]
MKQKKTIVITGGASGIGLAITRLFADKGHQVIFLDFNSNSGNQVAEEFKAKGGDVTFIQTDVSDLNSVKTAFDQIPETIDVLVNNAGISHVGNLEDTSEEDLDRLFQVNVKGVYTCSIEAIPKLRTNGGGSIINMCSVAASMGLPDRFAYSMTKGAVLSMTLSIARDYVAEQIRCNCISPGRVHTPFVDGFLAKNYPGQEKEMFAKLAATQPIGRMGKPEEIAAMVYYLASDEASFITGSNFPIDGGFLGLKA